MTTVRKMFSALLPSVAALVLACLSPAPTRAASPDDAQDLVDEANITVTNMRRDREFGTARDLMSQARAVMIVPELVKGGFILGGEGGGAVLLTKQADRSWSDPAFYSLASASVGFQIGLEQSEMVLFVLSDRALDAFMSDEFKVGAQAGLAIVTLGSMAEASTTSHFNADIVVWASSTGAYAGLTLNGSVIKPRDSYNEAYYGRPESPNTILLRHTAPHMSGSDRLRATLAGLS